MLTLQVERLNQDLNAITAHVKQLKAEGRKDTARKVIRKGHMLKQYISEISKSN